MKYTPTWLNRSWGRKNGFKGKTKRHSVDYDRERSVKLVRLNGEFSREDLMGIVWELETNYAMKGLFAPITNNRILKNRHVAFINDRDLTTEGNKK